MAIVYRDGMGLAETWSFVTGADIYVADRLSNATHLPQTNMVEIASTSVSTTQSRSVASRPRSTTRLKLTSSPTMN